jgi:hypothetical protein
VAREKGLLTPALGVAAAVLAVFADAAFRGRVLFERDILAFWAPHVSTLVRTIGAGRPPLWDAYEAFGQPMLGDPGWQIAYPPTWINLLLSPAAALGILVIAHFVAGGIGAAALARRWGLSTLAAMLAGVGFASAGPFLSMATLAHHVMGAAWLPWVLLAAEGLIAAPSARRVALLGAAAGGQALAGSADMCVMSLLAIAGRLVAWGVEERPRARQATAVLVALGAAAVLAGALAAIQWLPTASIVAASSRARFAAGQNLYWSVHPLSILEMAIPRLFSDLPLDAHVRADLYSGREPFLASLYVGLVPLLVGLSAPAAGRPGRRALILAVLFTLLGLGRHFWPASFVLTAFPLRLFRYPVKYFLPAALFWSLYFAAAADAWRREWSPVQRRRALVLAGLVAIVIATLAVALLTSSPSALAARFGVRAEFADWAAHLVRGKFVRALLLASAVTGLAAVRWRREDLRGAVTAALCVAAAADLITAGRGVNSLAPAELLDYRPPVVDVLAPSRDHLRVLATEDALPWLNEHFTRRPRDWPPEWAWGRGMLDRLAPPIAARWALRGSYQADFTGLADPALPLMSAAVLASQDTGLGLRLLRLANVGHVVTVQHRFAPLQEVARLDSVFDRPVRVLRVPEPLPAAYLVGGARHADTTEETLVQMADRAFEPTREVVLPAREAARPAPRGFRGSAVLALRSPDRLLIGTEANMPAWLVVVEAYAPGWKATVDGAPAPVLRANGLFRAVAVPAGRHQVELRYRPPSLGWGAAGSCVAVAVAASALTPRRRHRPPSPATA